LTSLPSHGFVKERKQQSDRTHVNKGDRTFDKTKKAIAITLGENKSDHPSPDKRVIVSSIIPLMRAIALMSITLK
jgi:hypothetical protein